MTASTFFLWLQFLSSTALCLSSIQNVALNFNTATKEYEMKMSQGKNTFLELISKGIFVDKTLLIDAFIRHPKQYLVILRPSGWGKTINLDMLRMFFEMPLYPNGTRILPISSTPNYRLFKEGKYYSNGYNITLKSPLLISQPEYWNHVKEHLGQYPVIHWSFDEIPFTNETNEKAIVAEINKKVYDQHRYLPTKNSKRYSSDNIPTLIRRLNDYFKKKAVVLVDCYDRFLKVAKKSRKIDHLLLDCAESNHCDRKKTIFTDTRKRDLDLLDYPNMFHHDTPFRNLYGLICAEMSLIYNHYSITKQEQNLIQYWYGGFINLESFFYYGFKPNETKQEIFHPSATCSYLNTRQFESFSLHTKYNSYMKKLMKLESSLYLFTGFINGGYISNCMCLRQSPYSCKTPSEFKFLFYEGYFVGAEFSDCAIPNFQTANHLRNTLASYYNALFDRCWSTLLNETYFMWDWFLLGDEATSYKLQSNMNECYKMLSTYYQNIVENNLGEPISNAVKTQLSAVASIMSSKKLHFVGWHYKYFPRNECDRLPETNILLSSGTRGVLMSIREDEDEINSVFNQSSKYIQILKPYAEFHGWKDIKFVDVKLLPYDKLEIHATIWPLNN